jgi:signal transduction histidine kinase
MPLFQRLSIRTHIMVMVLVGAITPMVLIGVWLTASAVRSGRLLLDEQLQTALGALADGVGRRWAFQQGDLLLLAGNTAAQRVVTGQRVSSSDSLYLSQLYGQMGRAVAGFVFRDISGRVRWSTVPVVERAQENPLRSTSPDATFTVSYPVHDSTGRVIGHMDAHIVLARVLSADSGRLAVPGAALGVRDRTNGAVLVSISASAPFMDRPEATIDGERWRGAVRSLDQPQIDLAVAAPIGPYVAPFRSAGRVGLVAVGVVALIAVLFSAFLTARLTSPLERLAEASSAIARGDLSRRVEGRGPSEINTLTSSFNTMAVSLRRTMDELSRRSALAAVGEFAASLAHEVRNALTSVRVDLQRAEERLSSEAGAGDLVKRSLVTVSRLDATVTGALRVARSGQTDRRSIDLRSVLTAATGAAMPTFASRGVTLDFSQLPSDAMSVSGDAGALQQLFLNLLLNAGQASRSGDSAVLSAVRENGHIIISIADHGVGIAPENLGRILEPFFTTRPDGTGLGLPIARQIATAHGGEIAIASEVGRGTTVRVHLPLAG